jgi:predicted dehydrogenase
LTRYRVGVAGIARGAGFVNQFPVFPQVEIAALCDLDRAAIAEVAQPLGLPDSALFTDYGRFLEAPLDIVVVSTPMQYHAEQVVDALESGKHVLSEVTAATTIADCERIVQTVKRTGLIYMMAENTCYYHFIRQWQEWIRAGRLGDIFYAEAEYIHEIHRMIYNRDTGERYWRAGRPPIYYCSHSLGPLLMLMEDRVVQAAGAHAGYSILPADIGPGALNMEVALFKTQRGAVIKLLRSSTAYRQPAIHFYSLYGNRGFVENDRAWGWSGSKGKLYVHGEMAAEHPLHELAIQFREGDDHFQMIDCPTADPDAPPEALRGGHGSAEYYLIRDFLTAVEQKARPPIDVIRAMDFTVPGIVAHEAALAGKWLDVPQFEW